MITARLRLQNLCECFVARLGAWIARDDNLRPLSGVTPDVGIVLNARLSDKWVGGGLCQTEQHYSRAERTREVYIFTAQREEHSYFLGHVKFVDA